MRGNLNGSVCGGVELDNKKVYVFFEIGALDATFSIQYQSENLIFISYKVSSTNGKKNNFYYIFSSPRLRFYYRKL